MAKNDKGSKDRGRAGKEKATQRHEKEVQTQKIVEKHFPYPNTGGSSKGDDKDK